MRARPSSESAVGGGGSRVLVDVSALGLRVQRGARRVPPEMSEDWVLG